MQDLKLSDRGNMETPTDIVAKTVKSVQLPPFEALTLQRAMTLYPTALALKPGITGLPSNEFLANFLSGRRTYLAIVRKQFGDDFKNFENYSLQRVQTSKVVRDRLIAALHGDEKLLEQVAGWMRSGTLLGEMEEATTTLERVLYQLMQGLASGSLPCPHCQSELISRPAQWWSQQSCTLGAPEYRLVDRILYDLLAVIWLPWGFHGNRSAWEPAVRRLASLCDAGKHPFKHWLEDVGDAFRAKDLTALATRAGLAGPSPDSHLQRVSRGEMLTAETIECVTARLSQPKALRDLGMHTRVLTFAIDFLVAADCEKAPASWETAQAIVKARIIQLGSDLRLSMAAGTKVITAT